MIGRLINLELSKNKQTVINIVASVVNLLITTLISFCLSPYIVKNIGVEANGFVSLANSFISYMLLARTALNSMGSRFLMIAYYNNEEEKVERYYSSLFFADLILALFFGIVGGMCIWKLEFLMEIPSEILADVKWLFALLFLNFIFATAITVWSTSTYIKNKLYLDSISSSLNSVVRALVILGLFLCLNPFVYFVGIGTIAGGLISYILSFFYKRTLFPQLKAKISHFSFSAIKELISSGIWNSISSLGAILTSSLDLLVANLFVGATAMGVLSVAKTMPVFVDTLITTIAMTFIPSLIIDFSKSNSKGIIKTVNQSSKIISAVCTIPLAFLIVYGKEFYSLWQPSQDAELLHILSVITIFGRVFFTGAEPLFHIFTVVNKVKQNAIVLLINSIISISLTLLLVKFTDLGVYAIAAVSVVCCFVKNMVFVIPYSAKYLGLKKKTFFLTVGYSILCCGVLCVWGYIEKFIFNGDSWFNLILSAVVFAVIGFLMTAFLILNKEERKFLFETIKGKIRKKK